MMRRKAQSMKLTLTFSAACLCLLLQACKGKPEEMQTAVRNGAYKIVVRTQEFHHSGTVNTEACIAPADDTKFPGNESQCFLRGYDFSDLSTSWKSPTEITINFRCGRITHFTNDPIVDHGGAMPQGFYVYLNDLCTLHDRTGDTQH
jgi:hypothetical protein